jgi:hypothetical protein
VRAQASTNLSEAPSCVLRRRWICPRPPMSTPSSHRPPSPPATLAPRGPTVGRGKFRQGSVPASVLLFYIRMQILCYIGNSLCHALLRRRRGRSCAGRQPPLDFFNLFEARYYIAGSNACYGGT